MHTNELKRLRQDFEIRAATYPDLTLTICFESASQKTDLTTIKKPNHKIMLWQYIGNMTGDEAKDHGAFQVDTFGLVNAQFSAFALIEGADTELFCRMAYRAGSLIPEVVRLAITQAIMDNMRDDELPGKPIFAANRDPLSVWLNLVFVCLTTFQSERMTRATLPIDPFAASLAAFDHLLSPLHKPHTVRDDEPPSSLLATHFDVSLSFPGEKREFVAQVAADLRHQSLKVFYDQYFEAQLAQPNLDTLLQRIYHDNSNLVAVFICNDYERKEWCGLEWRAIRDLIKKKQERNVILFRFDDAEVSGLFGIDGYFDLQGRMPEDAVKAILQRIAVQPHG